MVQQVFSVAGTIDATLPRGTRLPAGSPERQARRRQTAFGQEWLAHVRGDIRSIYNRAKYLPERVKLYQWWADYVDGLRQQGSQLDTGMSIT